MPGFLIGIVVGAIAMSAYSKKKSGASLSSSLSSMVGGSGESYRDTVASGGRADELSSAGQSPIRSENMSSVNAGDGTPSASSGSGSSGMSQPMGGMGTSSGQSPASGLSESRH